VLVPVVGARSGPGPPSRPYVSGVVARGWNIDCSVRGLSRGASTSGLCRCLRVLVVVRGGTWCVVGAGRFGTLLGPEATPGWVGFAGLLVLVLAWCPSLRGWVRVRRGVASWWPVVV